MADVRFSQMQEKLEDTLAKIQNLHIQSTGVNVINLYNAIVELQAVYNMLADVINEQAGGRNGWKRN